MDSARAELKQTIEAALAALKKALKDQTLLEALARHLTFRSFGIKTPSIARDELVRKFRASPEFKSLNEYVSSRALFRQVIIGIDETKEPPGPKQPGALPSVFEGGAVDFAFFCFISGGWPGAPSSV